MKIERNASEAEMVLEFVRAEAGKLIGGRADLSDSDQNWKRMSILDFLRGYARRDYIFRNFPLNVTWARVTLDRQDFLKLRYVRCSPWRQLAGDDLRVSVGAQRIRDHSFDLDREGLRLLAINIEALASAIKNRTDLPPVILAEAPDELIVLEGNHRATAFLIAQSTGELPAICGSSPSMHVWARESWS